MKSYIIFSLLIATACAASLGKNEDSKVSASTITTTIKPSLKPESVKVEAVSKGVSANEIVADSKLIKGVEKVDEDCQEASKVGAKTLETFTKVLSSDEGKDAKAKVTEEIVKEITKTEDVSVSHAENHLHTRQTEGLDQEGAGSQLFGINNGGYSSGGIVTSERIISSGGNNVVYNQGGGLIGSGQVLNSGGLIGSGQLLSSGGLVSSGQVLNSGGLIGSGQVLNSGGLIGSGQVLNSGGLIGSGQVLNSGNIIGTGSQIYNAGGSTIRSGQIGSSQLIGSGYQSGGNIGISGNIASGNRQQIVLGLDALDSVPQTVEYSKQFYSFEAPEEIQEEGQVTQQLSNVLKKNLQVIFINAPENSATTNAAIQLAKQAIEQQTAIYILSKEAESAQLVGELAQIQESIQTPPEVKIIKYRTPEDLERAKQEIQLQYEATGGSTEAFNGGIVPVLNYASAKEASKGIEALLGPGIVSTSVIGGSGNYGASSNNVVSTIGGGQSVSSGRDALLGSSVGQLNVIKSSNTGLTSSNIGSSGSSTGSSKYFQSGPVIGSNSGSNTVYTRESGSNSVVGPTKFPVNSNVALKPTGSSGGSLINTYNVGSNDGFGSSSLQGSSSGQSNVVVGGPSATNYVSKTTTTTTTTSSGSGSGLANTLGSGSSGSSFGSGSANSFGSGSTLGSSSGSKTSGSISSFGSGSSNTFGSGTSGSSFGSGSSNTFGSGSSLGSSSGSKTSGSVSIVGSGSSNTLGSGSSGSSFGSGSSNTFGSGSSGSSFGSGSSNTIGSGSLLGSNSGSTTTQTTYQTTSTKTTGSGSLGGPGVGNYASHVTVESSKFGGSGGNSGSGSGYASGLGIGSSIGELVKTDNYSGSASERVLSVEATTPSSYYSSSSTTRSPSSYSPSSTTTPYSSSISSTTPSNQYLPPGQKKK